MKWYSNRIATQTQKYLHVVINNFVVDILLLYDLELFAFKMNQNMINIERSTKEIDEF